MALRLQDVFLPSESGPCLRMASFSFGMQHHTNLSPLWWGRGGPIMPAGSESTKRDATGAMLWPKSDQTEGALLQGAKHTTETVKSNFAFLLHSPNHPDAVPFCADGPYGPVNRWCMATAADRSGALCSDVFSKRPKLLWSISATTAELIDSGSDA